MTTTARASRTGTARQPGPAEARLLRQAAAGAALAAVSYALQPVIVFAFAPPVSGTAPADQYSDVADLAARTWQGPVEAAVFCGVGLGFLLLALAVGRLLTRRGDAAGSPGAGGPLWPELMRVLGIISAAGWLLTAGLSLAGYSPIALNLAETGADATAQRAAIQLSGVVVTGAVSLAAIALTGWLLGLGVLGRRHGLIGWPLAAASALLALACVLSAALASSPYAVLGLIPYLLVLAGAFWFKARRLRVPLV